MASAQQLKALLKSHIEGDDTHFYSVAMQVAAHEAKLGHGRLAVELRALIDSAKSRRSAESLIRKPIPINAPKGELAGLLDVSYPKTRLTDMILDEDIEKQLKRVIKEQKHLAQIRSYGLQPRRKILLMGLPGTGKTMTASALAGELGIPLLSVRLDSLITKFMGETAAKLRQVFDAIEDVRGVYFFDEFDAIGSQRGLSNDVGEIRRVLNSFLQMIEHDSSNSLILAATNHPEILDYALFRRFDDLIHYGLPESKQIEQLLNHRLAGFSSPNWDWGMIAQKALGLSYGDISRAAEETMKDALIHDRQTIELVDMIQNIEDRKSFKNRNRTDK